MKYNELVIQQSNFTYSVNLQLDLRDESKMLQFIPNETISDLLNDFFIDITRSKSRNNSRILYGSYGTGKSHFITVLSAILGKYYKTNVYENLLNKLSSINQELVIDINNYITSSEPFLVVPIVYDFEDFEHAIYFSLKKALEEKKIKVSLKNFYTSALKVVDSWLLNEELHEKLKKGCNEHNISTKLLIKGLKGFDEKYGDVFRKIFEVMAFGVPFVQESTNLIDNLDEINKYVRESGYRGIVFIFDEFGRYIEDNIKKIRIKSIQNFAEYCDHSSYNNHLILISHKEISQYTNKFDKDIVNEWKKVEGRFKSYSIAQRDDQYLDLIKYVIPKNEEVWCDFKEKNYDYLNNLFDAMSWFRGFSHNENQAQEILEYGYPLHPMALFILDKLSKKVAQNERTFFTFLAGRENGSLYDFLETYEMEQFHFVGIDWIFDYFEPNIKSLRGTDEYQILNILNIAIKNCDPSYKYYQYCIKILKAIAAIEIVADYESIKPNDDIICNVIDGTKEYIEEALAWLKDARIIKYYRTYGYYRFYQASDFDIDKKINELINTSNEFESIVKTLNEEFALPSVFPYKYNDVYKMKRFFMPKFISINQIDKHKKEFSSSYVDGSIVYVISDKVIDFEQVEQLLTGDRIIYIMSDNIPYLIEDIKKYMALKYIELNIDDLVKDDPIAGLELNQYKQELTEYLQSEFDKWGSLHGDSIKVAYEGSITDNIKTAEDLSNFMSGIMLNHFKHTLIVNNEMVNKNNLTHTMVACRKEIVDKILTSENTEEYFELPYLSPSYTFLRSVLVKNGLYNEKQIIEFDNEALDDKAEGYRRAYSVIMKYLEKSKVAPILFQDIYDTLKRSPFGLRDGYIPLIVAALLRRYRSSTVIKHYETEQELCGDLFEKMIQNPCDYSIYIYQWEKEKQEYIESLELLFAQHINKKTQRKNRLKALYEGMFNHYKLLTKFARTSSTYVSSHSKKYRMLLEQEVQDYSEYFFDKFKILGPTYVQTINIIKDVKGELESLPNSIVNDLKSDIIGVLGLNNNEDLITQIDNIYNNDWKNKENKYFDHNTKGFITVIKQLSNIRDTGKFINNLSNTITGFEIGYWGDNHREEFVDTLKQIKLKLDSYDPSKELKSTEIRLTIEDSSGKAKPIVFEEKGISRNGEILKGTLKNHIKSFEQTISREERVKIVLDILSELVDK